MFGRAGHLWADGRSSEGSGGAARTKIGREDTRRSCKGRKAADEKIQSPHALCRIVSGGSDEIL